MRAFGVLASAILVSAGLAACVTDYQKGLDDKTYASPNALEGQTAPGGTLDNATTAGSTGSAAGTTLCEKKGGSLVPQTTPCTTSFAKDVLPAIVKGNCSTAACHGTKTPTTQPEVDATDPAGSWASMANLQGTNGRFLVNPCSKAPADSFIQYNMDPTAAATDRGVLMPSGLATGVPDAIPVITTWVACGAPNN